MASLLPHTATLGDKFARHLLRRATFTYTKGLVSQFSQLTPAQALDLLLTPSVPTLPIPNDPTDGFWTESPNLSTTFGQQEQKTAVVSGWWWYNAVNSPTLQYKLSHFLSTRFTIAKNNNAGSSTDFYDYIRLLSFFALGSYKTLAKKVTVNNAMLSYLNNTANNKEAPNENYAREFLELFTIGKGAPIAPGNYTTYTEADVVQAAKLLTGFKKQPDRLNIDPDTNIPRGYNSFENHDTNAKTFSSAFGGQTIGGATSANGMYDELDAYVELIFAQMATAKNICRKLYMYFVKSHISEEAENDIIAPLAQQLFENNYELAPVVRRLLESLHFYDLDDDNATDEIIGGIIKSPLQLIAEVVTFLQVALPDPETDTTNFYLSFWKSFAHDTFLKSAGMSLFDPENVAGHPAYHQSPDFDRSWISASTLIARYKLSDCLLEGKNLLSDSSTIVATTDVLAWVNSGIVSDPGNPVVLTSEICNNLFAQQPEQQRIDFFMNTFLLQGQPASDWTSLWSFYLEANFTAVVELRLKSLLLNILRAPECQMF